MCLPNFNGSGAVRVCLVLRLVSLPLTRTLAHSHNNDTGFRRSIIYFTLSQHRTITPPPSLYVCCGWWLAVRVDFMLIIMLYMYRLSAFGRRSRIVTTVFNSIHTHTRLQAY